MGSGGQAIIAGMETDDNSPVKAHIDTLVQLERMKVWRQAFVAFTQSTGTASWSDGAVRASQWADAALRAFDKQFVPGN